VIDVIWPAISAYLPAVVDHHPLGCHRPRVGDRLVVERLLHRVVTGCSYEDASVEGCSATTMRTRRDEWIDAGVFDALWTEVLAAYDRVVGLVLDDISIDGCITKAPCGGEHAGRSPVDRGKQGTKRSVAVDGRGVPIAVVCAPANRVDHQLLDPTLAELARFNLPEQPSIHLDRGYDTRACRALLADASFDPRVASKRTGSGMKSRQRWVVERTNAWHNQFGQLRRCTDRKARCVELSVLLANVIIVVRRLLARAYRYRIT
jgi:transposase